MARQTNRLTAREVAALSKPGRHSDGGNLYLFIDDEGQRRWIFRYVRRGHAREMGLGGYPATSLAEARRKAQEARKLAEVLTLWKPKGSQLPSGTPDFRPMCR